MKELTAKYNFQSYLYKNLNAEAYKQNDPNCRKLLHTLESIELIESTLALNLDNSSPERNAFLLLNRQFIGAAQERLSQEFTKNYPELAKVGYVNTVKEKNKSWFAYERRAVAHSRDLSLLHDTTIDEDITKDLLDLKTLVISILKKELNNEEFVANLIEQKINFNPQITPKRHTNLEPGYSSNESLENIESILIELQPYLEPQEAKIFYNSPGRQALIFFAEQAIGNNIKLYMQQTNYQNIPENWHRFIETRNRIAHSTLFRGLVYNKREYWFHLEENFKSQNSFCKEVSNLLDKSIEIPDQVESFEKTKAVVSLEPVSIIAKQLESFSIQSKSQTKQNKKNNPTKQQQVSEELVDYTILRTQYELLMTEYLQIIEEVKNIKTSLDLQDKLNIDYKFVFKKRHEYKDKDKIIVTYALGNEPELNDSNVLKVPQALYVQYYFNKSSLVPDSVEFDLLSYMIIKGCTNDKVMRHLINNGANINTLVTSSDGCKHSLLHHAVEHNDVRLVRCLLKNGADYNTTDILGCPPIYYAIECKYSDIVLEFMQQGDDISKITYLNQDYFHHKFPDKKIHDDGWRPPFHYALIVDPNLACTMLKLFIAQTQDLNLVKDLLNKKVNFTREGIPLNVLDILSQTTDIPRSIKYFIGTIDTICKDQDNYEMHKYVLLNDQEAINTKLGKCSNVQQHCDFYTQRISPTICEQDHQSKGYTIGELAKAMDYTQLYTSIQEGFKQSLSTKYNINTKVNSLVR